MPAFTPLVHVALDVGQSDDEGGAAPHLVGLGPTDGDASQELILVLRAEIGEGRHRMGIEALPPTLG